MKKLTFDRGLLLTDMTVFYQGQVVTLPRVLVDTGSASTIISSDLAQSIGITACDNDRIVQIVGIGGTEYVYTKAVDSIQIGERKIEEPIIEVGLMDYGVHLDGILGLDLLKRFNAMINIEDYSLNLG